MDVTVLIIMNRLINASFLTRSRKGIFPSLNQRTPTAVPFSHISSIVGIDDPRPTITSNFLVMVNNANCNSDERGLSHKNNFTRPMVLESQYPPFLNSARNVYHGGKSEFLLCTTGFPSGFLPIHVRWQAVVSLCWIVFIPPFFIFFLLFFNICSIIMIHFIIILMFVTKY